MSNVVGDVDNMFKDFVPMQLACLRKYTDLIPGTKKTVDTLRSDFGLKIGSTTGFLKNMVDILLEDAKKQGYQPDASVAGRFFAENKAKEYVINSRHFYTRWINCLQLMTLLFLAHPSRRLRGS